MVRDRRNRANPPGNYIYGFTRVSRHMACCLVHSMMVATPEFGSSNHLVILNALGFRQPTRPGCGRFGTSYPLVVRLAARLYKWNIWEKTIETTSMGLSETKQTIPLKVAQEVFRPLVCCRCYRNLIRDPRVVPGGGSGGWLGDAPKMTGTLTNRMFFTIVYHNSHS